MENLWVYIVQAAVVAVTMIVGVRIGRQQGHQKAMHIIGGLSSASVGRSGSEVVVNLNGKAVSKMLKSIRRVFPALSDPVNAVQFSIIFLDTIAKILEEDLQTDNDDGVTIRLGFLRDFTDKMYANFGAKSDAQTKAI